MRKKDTKLIFINVCTTIVTILLPLLNFQVYTEYIFNKIHVELGNFQMFILIGMIISNGVSIWLLFNVSKALFSYCQLSIDYSVLYFLLVTSKLFAGLINAIFINSKSGFILIIIREGCFCGMFAMLVYKYFSPLIEEKRRTI